MPRFEIKDGPITVAYGVDHATGMFLSVQDARLEYQESASQEVNDVAQKIGVKDGGGSFFDLHTGKHGFGQKVSKETILVYLKRFGVTDEQIKALDGDKKTTAVPEQQKCSVCQTLTSKRCQKCKTVFYCGAGCQKTDWSVHKWFCGQLPFAEAPKDPKDTRKRVRAIYFAEADAAPKIIYAPVRRIDFEGEVMEKLEPEEWVKHMGHTVMRINPLKSQEWLPKSLEVVYRDNYFSDGSKPNKTVANFMNGKQVHDWRGPLMVCKLDGIYGAEVYGPNYTDMGLEDLQNVRDFFLSYPKLTV